MTQSNEPADGIRLNKLLADCGVASRRAADEMIAEGKVMVDDQIVTKLGTRVNPEVQRVDVDGVLLRRDSAPRQYYLLNKPAGVVCTNEKRETRPRAVDLITDRRKGRIYSVGRLDEDTVGLLILTNDGEFAHRVSHPRYGVSKTYMVKLDGRISEGALQKVREGIYLSDGRTAGARILVQRRTDRQSTLLVTLQEGRNREVRRIFAKVGWNVRSLRRTRVGDLTDRGLKVGHWRPLSAAEVRDLLALADGTTPKIGGKRGRSDAKRGSRARERQPQRPEGQRASQRGPRSSGEPAGSQLGRGTSSAPRRRRAGIQSSDRMHSEKR